MNKLHNGVDLWFYLPWNVLELHFNVLDKTRAMNLNCGLFLKTCVSVRNALTDSERQLWNSGFTEIIFHTLKKKRSGYGQLLVLVPWFSSFWADIFKILLNLSCQSPTTKMAPGMKLKAPGVWQEEALEGINNRKEVFFPNPQQTTSHWLESCHMGTLRGKEAGDRSI